MKSRSALTFRASWESALRMRIPFFHEGVSCFLLDVRSYLKGHSLDRHR